MTGWRISGAPPRSSARRSASSSSRPRLPGGFVRLARWRSAASAPPGGGGAIALRSAARRVIARSPRLDRERNARDHEHHRVAHRRHALIHAAEQISESQPRRGLGVHALPDLVGHHGETRLTAADEPGEGVGFIEDRLVAIAAQQAIGDPEREAIDDESVAGTLELLETRHELERHLDRGPLRWALRAMPRDATAHVRVERLGRRHEGDATLGGAPLDGVAALAAARAADHEERCDHLPAPPAKTGCGSAPGQVSWLSDRPTPRAFPTRSGQWHLRVSSPITVTGSRRLGPAFPEALTAIPSANNVANASKIASRSQPRSTFPRSAVRDALEGPD